MTSRIFALFAGSLWLGLAVVLLVTGTGLMAAISWPCFVGLQLCEAVQNAVVYEVFLGQVAVDPARRVLSLLPWLTMALGMLTLYGAYEHLRYATVKNRSAIDAVAVLLTLFIVSLLIFADQITGTLLPPLLERMQTVASATPEQLRSFETLQDSLRSGGLLFGGTMLFLTGALLVLPQSPPPFIRQQYLQGEYQCRRCGLTGDNTVPTCILCQPYYSYRIPPEKREQLQTGVLQYGDEWTLPLHIQATRTNVPVQRLSVHLSMGRVFEVVAHESAASWKLIAMTGQQGDYLLEGPPYLTDDTTISIQLRVTDAANHQPQRQQQHTVEVAVSTVGGVASEPDRLRLVVQRDPNRREEMLSTTRSTLQERLNQSRRVTWRVLSSLARTVRQWAQGARQALQKRLADRRNDPPTRPNPPGSSDEGDASSDA